MPKTERIVLTLKNGFTVRSDSEEYELGEYVRICDEQGTELLYWDNAEWQENPVEVMGAILGAMMHPEKITRTIASAYVASIDNK